MKATVTFAFIVCSLPAIASPAAGQELISRAEEQQLQQEYPDYRHVAPDYRHAGTAALNRWMDWKWGLRIHWGLYCMFNGRESWIITQHLKDREWLMHYYTSYQVFDPTNFKADRWMTIMQRAGMKYFTFTTKHHEGYCMWPTKTWQRGFERRPGGTCEEVTNHFSIAESPYQKDIVGQLVRAAHAHGIGVGLYYSHIDWHDWDFAWDKRNFWYDPAFTKESQPQRWAAFIKKERDQITELLTGYGRIDVLSLDMDWPKAAQSDAYGVARLARRLQPNILMRKRGIGNYGDYETPERSIPEDPNQYRGRPWQVIYPGGTDFSYKTHDTYKPREWILEKLIDIVSKGGNFQIGFGPDPTGEWPQEMIDRITYVGDWLKVNGESIYGTRPYLRYHEGTDLRFTRTKDKKFVYVICLKWPGRELKTQLVRAKTGSNVRLLGWDKTLAWKQNQTGLVIALPQELQRQDQRPCRQAYAFKIESEDWNKVRAALPDTP